MIDLIAGPVDFGCDQITNVVPHLQAGTIKAFVIATLDPQQRTSAAVTIPADESTTILAPGRCIAP